MQYKVEDRANGHNGGDNLSRLWINGVTLLECTFSSGPPGLSVVRVKAGMNFIELRETNTRF